MEATSLVVGRQGCAGNMAAGCIRVDRAAAKTRGARPGPGPAQSADAAGRCRPAAAGLLMAWKACSANLQSWLNRSKRLYCTRAKVHYFAGPWHRLARIVPT